MAKAYVATVQLLVLADSHIEAVDAISELLSGTVEASHDTFLLDWAYLKLGGCYLYPTPYPVPINVKKYEEGSFTR